MGFEHVSGSVAQKWIRAFLTILAAAFLVAAPLVRAISADTLRPDARGKVVPTCPDGKTCCGLNANDTMGPGNADTDLLVIGGTRGLDPGTHMYNNHQLHNHPALHLPHPQIAI